MNAAKLHMNWRSVMRNAKAEELRGAVSALAQRFERAIDRRDLLIQARMPPAGLCLGMRALHASWAAISAYVQSCLHAFAFSLTDCQQSRTALPLTLPHDDTADIQVPPVLQR